MADAEARFWSKVDRRGPEECWAWLGATTLDGYGQLWMGRAKVRAHRHSYALHRGPIPDRMAVLHRCDNPPCVNPAHLWTGTIADNNADTWAKGRAGGAPAAGAAQTHCVNGHPFDGDNLRPEGSRRRCRMCGLERNRRWRARQRSVSAGVRLTEGGNK